MQCHINLCQGAVWISGEEGQLAGPSDNYHCQVGGSPLATEQKKTGKERHQRSSKHLQKYEIIPNLLT